MRFTLIDRILELEPASFICAVKNLTMAEEYLAEHFPGFPVMPGVMMLEALTQAGAWLIRATEGFSHSIILLHEAKTVKYGQFVTPGKQLTVRCQWVSDEDGLTSFKANGEMDGKQSVSARLVLKRFNLADRDPLFRRQDQRLKAHQLQTFQTLASPDLRRRLIEAKVESALG